MNRKAEVSLSLRNGTVDFLLYPQEEGSNGIEVRVQDGTVWLNQAGMAELYGVVRNAITKHIQNIYASGEQDITATCSKMEQVADNGKTYQYLFYSLDMIIAVCYRVNSERAVQFRQWATK